jgi:hypothetical protein
MNFYSRVKRIEKMLTGPRAVPEEDLTQTMCFYAETQEVIDAAIAKRQEEVCAKYGQAALDKINFLVYVASKINKPPYAGTSGIE